MDVEGACVPEEMLVAGGRLVLWIDGRLPSEDVSETAAHNDNRAGLLSLSAESLPGEQEARGGHCTATLWNAGAPNAACKAA